MAPVGTVDRLRARSRPASMMTMMNGASQHRTEPTMTSPTVPRSRLVVDRATADDNDDGRDHDQRKTGSAVSLLVARLRHRRSNFLVLAVVLTTLVGMMVMMLITILVPSSSSSTSSSSSSLPLPNLPSWLPGGGGRRRLASWGGHARVVAYVPGAFSTSGGEDLDHLPRPQHEERSVVGMTSAKYLKRLQDSHKYNSGREERFETKTCKAQYDWQLHSFPSCNAFHEREMASQLMAQARKRLHDNAANGEDEDDYYDDQFRHLGNGYWRDVWLLPASSFDSIQVLKTMRYEHDYTPRNFDRHRRDALAMERLSAHPFVMDIYGFCGNSGVFEYASGGDIKDALFPYDKPSHKSHLPKLERLHIATQASIGLAAFHNFDQEGVPSVAHTDVGPTQFVRVGEIFKLNDFNRCRFLRKNIETGGICSYHVGHNPGKNRAPEEYAYDPQTEKVDVFSLGNIFYMLLMDMTPFHGISEKKAKKALQNGRRALLYEDVANSTHPVDVAIRTAMYMAHVQDPEQRSSSREIETYLKARLEEIDPGRVDAWFESAKRARQG